MLIAKLNGQKLTVASDTVVSDSVKYLTVRFEFSKEWDGYLKTAMFFGEDGSSYIVPMLEGNSMYLGEDTCYIPYEVIKSPGFELSVFGTRDGSIITADKAAVQVKESGYCEGEAPREPTINEYNQLMEVASNAFNEAQLANQTVAENSFNFQNQLDAKMDKFGEVYEQSVTFDKTAYFNGQINCFVGEARFEGEIDVLNPPTTHLSAVNKEYVDGLVGDIEAALDGIIALQQELIGGKS